MAKGEDAIRKKKNKALRKKLHKDTSTRVSARIADIIAAKKRRKSGKRRLCQGMCYSLPTPEDPFNDHHGKNISSKKEIDNLNVKNISSKKENGYLYSSEAVPRQGRSASLPKKDIVMDTAKHKESKMATQMSPGNEQFGLLKATPALRLRGTKISDCPSKFLMMCLRSIQDDLQKDGGYSYVDKQMFFNSWGIELWKCYSVGIDMLDTSQSGSLTEQIGWVASAAADAFSRKGNEGLCCVIPFLLFLVPSQEKATKVRSVCKSLKSFGIHTLSLHPGASLDHQIHGLKSCKPTFIVSTPSRLLELIALKAVDISGVSVVVVDGMDTHSRDAYVNMIMSIRKSISGSPYTVVFNDCSSHAAVKMVRNLLPGMVCRFTLDGCIRSQSACIVQSVQVFASQEEKLSQGVQVLVQTCGRQLSHPCKVLIANVKENSKSGELVAAIKSKSCLSRENFSYWDAEFCYMDLAFSVINVEKINSIDLQGYEVVILPDFVPSIDMYGQILTRMARHTVKGLLCTFFTLENADLAGPFIDVLCQCGQAVPEALFNVCHSS